MNGVSNSVRFRTYNKFMVKSSLESPSMPRLTIFEKTET